MARKHLTFVGLLAAIMMLLAAPAAHAALVAYWPLDNINGVNDVSGNANHGTLVDGGGAAPYYGADRNGNATSALYMDGANDYMRAASLTSTPTKFSVSWWLDPTAARQWNQKMDAGGWDRFVFHTTPTWEVYAGVDYGGSWTSRFSPTQLPAGTIAQDQWQFLAFTFDNGNAAFYKYDSAGRLVRSATKSGMNMPRQWQGFNVGATNTDTIQGAVDDVAVYNSALSPIDVRNLAAGAVSPTGTADTQNVTYRITVSSRDTNDAGIAAFVNDAQEWYYSGKQGVPFIARAGWTPADYTSWPVVAAGGNKTITQTGSLPMRVSNDGSVSDYIQLAAKGTGTYSGDDYLNHPYVAATFAAPIGYVFKYTSGQSQYLTTNSPGRFGTQDPTKAAWNVSYYDWSTSNYSPLDWSVNGGTYTATTPNPTLAGQGFAPGTEAIWGGVYAGPLQYAFLSTQATLAPGNWTLYGDPLTEVPGSVQGLSGLFVRTTGAISSLANADIALALRRGATSGGLTHDMAEARTNASPLARAHVDNQGDFTTPANVGVLAGWISNTGAATPDNIALRMAGYIQIPVITDPNGLAYSFATYGDDDAYMKIGDTEFTRGGGRILNTVVFPYNATTSSQVTYWPFEVVGRNTGAAGFEVSSALATWNSGTNMWDAPAFSNTTYKILGDATGGGLPVWTRDSALEPGNPTPTNLGGAPVTQRFAWADTGAATSGDGVWINANAGPGMDTRGSVTAWFAANPDGGTRAARNRINIDNSGSPGAFTATSSPTASADQNYPGMTTAQDNVAFRSRSLFYSPGNETVAFAVGSDDGFQLQLGTRVLGGCDDRGIQTEQNMMYAYFPTAGFYKFDLYHYEQGGGAGVELSYLLPVAPSNNVPLLLNSRNPNAAGFQVDMTNSRFHTFNMTGSMRQYDGLQIRGTAATTISGVAGNFPVDSWKLQQFFPTIQYLRTDPSGTPGFRSRWYNNDNFTEPFDGDFVVSEVNRATGVYPPALGWPTTGNGQEHFSVRYTGQIYIPADGTFGFRESVDDQAWIFLDGLQKLYDGAAGTTTQVYVPLTQGWHDIEFRTHEITGGDAAYFSWDGGDGTWRILTATETNTWVTLASGVDQLLDDTVLKTFPMDWNTTYQLRFTADFFGLQAIQAGDFIFMPEPGTMVLLAGGLLAVIRRRRRQASR